MPVTEIKIGGLGGQGVILAGLIMGKAAAIFDKKEATMTQAFGPEARGSACSAQLIVSDETILYPYVTRPRVLVTMSQDAYNKFSPEMAENGLLLIEEELVKVTTPPKGAKIYGIPATRIAEELGRKMVLNIVMVGFMTAITKVVNADAVRKAVEASVPKGTEKLNLSAFDRGYEYGVKKLQS
jgi:2-oxoglutarate ferredoxin oxidoreductase subunit gamma